MTTLGVIAETRLGKMLSKKAKVGNEPRPYLRNKNVQWGRIDLDDLLVMDFDGDELERFEVRSGDLMVCEGGEVGRAAIWRGLLDWIGYQKALHRVRPRVGLPGEFLLYAFMWLAQSHQLEHHVTGSTIKHLPQEDLREIQLPLPPLNEQRWIVAAIEEHLSRLDAADASLAAAMRRARVLVSASLSAAIAAHPKVELGAVTTHHRYGTSVKCTPEPGGVPVLRIPNVKGGRIDTSDLKFATRPDLGDCFVESGDLLVVRTNGSRDLIGRTAVVDGAAGMAFASYLIRVRPTADLDPAWAVIALSSPRLRREIEARAASTAGQYNLNLASLRSLPIPLPPLDEQRRIVDRVAEQLSAIDALRGAIERAQRRSASLRRAVLERAFRGELVPQDPTDEPAETLLARIRAERDLSVPDNRRSQSRRVRSNREPR